MDKVIVAIKQLLENSISQTNSPLKDIKCVFDGDPIKIEEDRLPALVVREVSDSFEMRGSRYDEKTHNVEIVLVYNQKQFFNSNSGAPRTITDALWATGEVVFASASHNYIVGNKILISGIDPSEYDGEYTITAKDANTFTCALASEPASYVSGGTAILKDIGTVNGAKDARLKIGSTTSANSTDKYTVCGTIQNNTYLPYTSGGVTSNMATIAKVTNVNYVGNNNSRGWYSYEVIVGVEVKVIADRLN